MILTYKDIAPNDINGNRTIKGGWIFDKMDYSALTHISETITYAYNDIVSITGSADIKYINPVMPHDYVEIWSEISQIDVVSVTIKTILKSRKRNSNEWTNSAIANFKFIFVDSHTQKPIRLSKEVINEIKG